MSGLNILRLVSPFSFFCLDFSCWVKLFETGSQPWLREVWSESFHNRLGIREKSHHAMCTVCLKHKLILKKLQSDRIAHQKQCELYGKHIQHQYSDRTVYWESRTQSRLNYLSQGHRLVCVILDGMDKSKYRLPRSLCMHAKDFSSFIRPSIDVHGVLMHGHLAALFLSDPFAAKDSSWCTDILSHVLDELGCSVDLRTVRLVAQSDNTCREVKNNTCLRALSYFVSTHRLHSAELRCLRTGHSHEDIDGWFSQLNSVLEANNELHTPTAFRDALDKYLQLPTTRPNEHGNKFTKIVNTVRDWFLDEEQSYVFWSYAWIILLHCAWYVNEAFSTWAFVSRKSFLAMRMCGNTLKGVGGPGAPHVFAFERFRDTGGLRNWFDVWSQEA